MDWSPDGSKLAFFFEDESGKSLQLWQAGSKGAQPLLRESDDLKLEAFHWAPDGASLLIESAGDLFLLDTTGGRLERLSSTESKEEDPKFSPDGARLAFVRDADLWVLELASGVERRLTSDGREVEILNGKTDWVYWEEIWNRDSTGHWWSPKGDRIAYYRFDEAPVATYPLLAYDDVYPKVVAQKYPKAGHDNPLVRVGVVDLESKATTWLDTGAPDEWYLARVDWLADGGRVAVQRLNREQDRLDLLLCSASDGGCSMLHSETAATWVNVTDDLRFLADGSFLWTSERSGWRRLEHRSADGSLAAELTPDGWTVDHVDAVVEGESAVVWTGYKTDELGARHRSLWRQPLDGSAAAPVVAEPGWHSAKVSPASGRLAVVSGTADRPASASVLGAAGLEAHLPSTPPTGYDPAELPSWEFLTIPGPDGVGLPAMLLRPAGAAPGARHPAIMYHYGGPASQVVTDRWGTRGRNLWHKLMAARGFVVLVVDNVASNYFGKRGADLLHRRFGARNLEAQLAGVRFLASLDFVDPERIGLWGASGGGANTLYSMLNSPGTWKAGVSVAPVTDWRLYDTIWTERYLDHPDDNSAGYADSSAVTYAERLADALLIVHGTADDNVHPQNTIVMSQRLIAAGKPFEQAIYPGQKHSFKGPDLEHLYRRMTEFFVRHLGAPSP
jgi:dipeptidyl-peptidase-4